MQGSRGPDNGIECRPGHEMRHRSKLRIALDSRRLHAKDHGELAQRGRVRYDTLEAELNDEARAVALLNGERER